MPHTENYKTYLCVTHAFQRHLTPRVLIGALKTNLNRLHEVTNYPYGNFLHLVGSDIDFECTKWTLSDLSSHGGQRWNLTPRSHQFPIPARQSLWKWTNWSWRKNNCCTKSKNVLRRRLNSLPQFFVYTATGLGSKISIPIYRELYITIVNIMVFL